MSKQDRQGVRKASDIEQKYDLSKLNDLTVMSQGQSEQMSKLNQLLSQFIVDINAKLEEVTLKVYPVDSVYVSLNASNPAELFGGSWELRAEGHLLTGLNQESEDALQEVFQTSDTCYIWKRTA